MSTQKEIPVTLRYNEDVDSDIVEIVNQTLSDHEKHGADPEITGSSAVEDTDAGKVATAPIQIQFDVPEGQDAEEVLNTVIRATNKLLQIHSSESGSAQLLR